MEYSFTLPSAKGEFYIMYVKVLWCIKKTFTIRDGKRESIGRIQYVCIDMEAAVLFTLIEMRWIASLPLTKIWVWVGSLCRALWEKWKHLNRYISKGFVKRFPLESLEVLQLWRQFLRPAPLENKLQKMTTFAKGAVIPFKLAFITSWHLW